MLCRGVQIARREGRVNCVVVLRIRGRDDDDYTIITCTIIDITNAITTPPPPCAWVRSTSCNATAALYQRFNVSGCHGDPIRQEVDPLDTCLPMSSVRSSVYRCQADDDMIHAALPIVPTVRVTAGITPWGMPRKRAL